jgi:hypothetical protein
MSSCLIDDWTGCICDTCVLMKKMTGLFYVVTDPSIGRDRSYLALAG